jgi:hypothetical protein
MPVLSEGALGAPVQVINDRGARAITPYKWVHPDADNRSSKAPRRTAAA